MSESFTFVLLLLLGVLCCSTARVPYTIVPIKDPTYVEEYRCVGDADPVDTNFTWHRQDWHTLPEGVKADDDKLHFLSSTSDLNGLYICTVTNQHGISSASLYRQNNSDDILLTWILNKILGLWSLLTQPYGLSRAFAL